MQVLSRTVGTAISQSDTYKDRLLYMGKRNIYSMIAGNGFLSSFTAMATDSNRHLVKNFFSLGFVQVVNSLLQLLVIPYVIARIGVENFGVVAVAQVIMFYLATLVDYGFNQTGTRDVSVSRHDQNSLSVIYSRVFFSKVFLCCIAILLFLILVLIFPFIQQNFLLYCLAFVYVPGQVFLPGWFFQGLEKMQWLAGVTLLSRVVFVVLVFVFVNGPEDSSLYLFFLGTGGLLAGIISMIIISSVLKVKYIKVTFREVMVLLKDGWPFTATNLSMNIIQYGNIFILRLFTNDLVAGYYGVAERIFFTMKQGLTIFSQAVYPKACQLADKGTTELLLFFKRIFPPFFLAVMAGSIAVVITAPFIVDLFMNENNEEAVFVLRMLCIVLPVVSLNIPGTLSLLALDWKKTYFIVYTSAVLISVIANVILADLYQVRGTIGAILITELFITVGVSVSLHRHANSKN